MLTYTPLIVLRPSLLYKLQPTYLCDKFYVQLGILLILFQLLFPMFILLWSPYFWSVFFPGAYFVSTYKVTSVKFNQTKHVDKIHVPDRTVFTVRLQGPGKGFNSVAKKTPRRGSPLQALRGGSTSPSLPPSSYDNNVNREPLFSPSTGLILQPHRKSWQWYVAALCAAFHKVSEGAGGPSGGKGFAGQKVGSLLVMQWHHQPEAKNQWVLRVFNWRHKTLTICLLVSYHILKTEKDTLKCGEGGVYNL